MNIKRTIFRDAVTPAESAGVTVFVMIVENQVPRNIETKEQNLFLQVSTIMV